MAQKEYLYLKRKLFFEKIDSLKSQYQIEEFFMTLMTSEEIDHLRKRWEIIEYLKISTPQYKIAGLVDVGIATVSRMARHLKTYKP